jgi:hypothetical protein
MILLSETVRIRLVVKTRPRRSARRRRRRRRLPRTDAPGSHAGRPFWVFWAPVPGPGRPIHQSQSQAICRSYQCQIEAARVAAHAPDRSFATGRLRPAVAEIGTLRHDMPHHGTAPPRALASLSYRRRRTLRGASFTAGRLTPNRLPRPARARAGSSRPALSMAASARAGPLWPTPPGRLSRPGSHRPTPPGRLAAGRLHPGPSPPAGSSRPGPPVTA